ncbi:nucleoporin 98 [Chlorella sorokiniana]|uniref:Nucleoporin 98 n=1 Tax=Chlorella sorokiniana TaxID=3076 RepID=A0A2P6TH69_CHLSO|nr:nucleoporin 98 [Chlorella sorokiniana]|eukprot:PRW33639.1 nucleoporin 98 [Chlorella sorokiniana]
MVDSESVPTSPTARTGPLAAAAADWHGAASAAAELGLDASLFKIVTGSSAGRVWELMSSGVLPRFDNAREGSNSVPEWHLKVEGAQNQISVLVPSEEPAPFSFDQGRNRVEFEADGERWALELRSARAFERFLQEFNRAAYDNRHGQQDRDLAFWEQRASELNRLQAGTNWSAKSQWHSLLAAFLGPQPDLTDVQTAQLLELIATNAAAAMRSLQDGAAVGPQERAGLASLLGTSPFATAEEVMAAYSLQTAGIQKQPSLAQPSEPTFTFGPASQPFSVSATASTPATGWGSAAAPFGGSAAAGGAAAVPAAAPAAPMFSFGASSSAASALPVFGAAGPSSGSGSAGAAMPAPFVFGAEANNPAAAVPDIGAAANQPENAPPAQQPAEQQVSVCVICYERPITHGFLHQDIVHSCICDTCKDEIKQRSQHRCPICRQWIEAIVAVHVP